MRTFRLSNETGRMLTHKQVCSPFRGSRMKAEKVSILLLLGSFSFPLC